MTAPTRRWVWSMQDDKQSIHGEFVRAADYDALAKRVEELEGRLHQSHLAQGRLGTQRDRALAVVEAARKLRATDEWFDLEDALAAFDKGE